MKRLTNTVGFSFKSELLWSDAFWKLTATEIRILLIFKTKCRVVGRVESKKMRVEIGTIKNNGQIIFTYDEAAEIGISEPTFRRAISNLVKLGFLDIARPGALYRSTLYSMSERWMEYGTEKFKRKERPKRKGAPKGFIKVKSKIPTVKNDGIITVKSNGSENIHNR